MMQFLIAAPSSGSGKTTVACAVLAALKKRGADPCAFKSGPDYIDPMFHRSALQVDSHNLDLFLSNRDMVRAIFARYAAGHGAAVCEGAMGFYDGQGLTTRASAWELADTLGLPVLLVVQPKGASVTLAAQIQGLVNFRKNSHVSGILLNDCSEKLYKMLKALLERETGLPVLGYLPHLPQAAVESRHLGLKTADEIADLQEKIALLADALVLDWQRLAVLTEKPAPEALPGAAAPTSVRIAVAKDEAFCFTYAETLDALRDAGAELVLFSPVQDAVLPENIGGLYLPGGYPELYAKTLSENKTMMASIRQAVQAGLPTAAECGGFLYLGRSLEDADGKAWPMADVLPGDGIRVGRLVRFGYAEMTAKADSMLFCAGETLPIHEFHHWDSTANGTAFTACKNEKVIQDKRKDTKTSESTALPCEQSYIDWNNSVARKNEKLYFAIEIKDFIDAYNYCYYQDYGKKYIQSLVTWYSYKQDFGRLKGDMCYEYTENKKILTLPTVAVYTIKHTKNIEAITVNFDDHSYTEKMYKKYEKLCFYCLKMLFPNMEKNKITSLYKKLNKKAYDHIFQTEKGFHSYNLPSDLYYRDGVGIYPYFAYGESVRMCIIPVDQKLIRSYRKKGVRLHRLDERKMKGK